MRPIASTAVASMQNIAAPDSARLLICVKCQSFASPLSEEYWHIGATMIRLGRVRLRSVMGENKALMKGFPVRRRHRAGSHYIVGRRAFLNRLALRTTSS